jgi:Domain of unknown function (DUF4926)
MANFNLLDTVATLKPISGGRLTLVEVEHQSLSILPVGQVGTVVEVYPIENRYLVEFADLQGQEYAMAILNPDEILAIRYELAIA